MTSCFMGTPGCQGETAQSIRVWPGDTGTEGVDSGCILKKEQLGFARDEIRCMRRGAGPTPTHMG